MSVVFRRFDCRDVSLDERGPYARAQRTGARYVLELDPDRLLYPFRQECGLDQPTDAEGNPVRAYPNWESMGMGGHICGHYLSALAQFWSATGRSEFRDRADYVVRELERCQQARADGYVGGIPGSDRLFSRLRGNDVQAQSFDLDGSWVPLYNLHKLFAGLLDCWQAFAPDAPVIAQTARRVVTRLADWWCALSDNMTDESFAMMLRCEFGGMNESFAELYRLTGDERYLAQAQRFCQSELFDRLAAGEDCLTGLHANTQIPKVLGYERLAQATGDSRYDRAVNTFWDSVVSHRSVSIGAHSVAEHFHPTDDFSSMITSRQGVETCNSYNMSKLAERLFLRTGAMRYLDFYERVLENHILSSVGTSERGFVYFTPMRPRHYRVYSSAQESFWCCVGSGLENHARYGRLIYAKAAPAQGVSETAAPALAVNLFIPSSVRWCEAGVDIRQSYAPGAGRLNEGTLTLTATRGDGSNNADSTREIRLYVRHPWWAEDVEYTFDGGDGRMISDNAVPGYDCLQVRWSGTMTVHIRHTVKVTMEPLPDGSAWVSILRGPVVMAQRNGDIDLQGLRGDDSRAGHIASGPLMPMSDLPIVQGYEVNGDTGRFDGTVDVTVTVPDMHDAGPDCMHGDARENDERELTHRVTLVPFADIEASRYTIYLPWAQHDDTRQIRAHLRDIDAQEASSDMRVCDEVRCGEQQSEVDHGYCAAGDEQGYADDTHYRVAHRHGWFSYQIKDWERSGDRLIVALLADDEQHPYQLLVGDTRLTKRAVRRREGALLLDEYPVPRGSLGVGDDMASCVKISADGTSDSPRVAAVRLMRS
ncbi:Beta-L-arabinofuranosidase [Bifidobacterium goeldii]|uniref:Beta-L-arabinofuranosidase n=1 Tax=Bifidobacterium goeldii TaxID=2306975 RepID=A0A430FLA0_9BIFI|nr:beta-L-arabinofuranosidase domain-containing protein [Bifidobacterium goeldii]RSX53560.1 Beta-L-arabinofuranosidase [Bifidobacterium goeldii]